MRLKGGGELVWSLIFADLKIVDHASWSWQGWSGTSEGEAL